MKEYEIGYLNYWNSFDSLPKDELDALMTEVMMNTLEDDDGFRAMEEEIAAEQEALTWELLTETWDKEGD